MSLHSAFGDRKVPRGSRRQLHLTVVAPDTPNMPEGRDAFYHGASPHEWSPYRPAMSRPIADYAGELVSCPGFQPVVRSLGGQADPAPGDPPSAPGLFLVDAWAARSAAQARWWRSGPAKPQRTREKRKRPQ